ncbi:MAG: RluA family pseudouridine synthase [Rhodocyclaceae bacterium]|nr:RluA family pseudouridine synthase [Rhodocyclaceae bacterium]
MDYIAAQTDTACVELRMPPELAGLRLDQALARLLPQYSRSRLQQWLKDGHVRIDGQCATIRHKIRGGEALQVLTQPTPEAAAERAEAIALDIVFEDEHLLVVNKAAGMVVHPGSGNWSGTLLNALLHHVPQAEGLERAGIVHRLDKDTSGLLVVAKTAAAQAELQAQLQARTVRRDYLALVHGDLTGAGNIEAAIGRHPTQRVRMAVLEDDEGREALTRYRVRESFARCALVECQLVTGRTHQIRVHMAHIGHPLVGDTVYGRRQHLHPPWVQFPRQALHAWRLGLQHPDSGQYLEWQRPPAADLAALLDALRAAEAAAEEAIRGAGAR